MVQILLQFYSRFRSCFNRLTVQFQSISSPVLVYRGLQIAISSRLKSGIFTNFKLMNDCIRKKILIKQIHNDYETNNNIKSFLLFLDKEDKLYTYCFDSSKCFCSSFCENVCLFLPHRVCIYIDLCSGSINIMNLNLQV